MPLVVHDGGQSIRIRWGDTWATFSLNDAMQVYQELPQAVRGLHAKLVDDARTKMAEGQLELQELDKVKLPLAAYDANG